jgi:hypothetical protein
MPPPAKSTNDRRWESNVLFFKCPKCRFWIATRSPSSLTKEQLHEMTFGLKCTAMCGWEGRLSGQNAFSIPVWQSAIFIFRFDLTLPLSVLRSCSGLLCVLVGYLEVPCGFTRDYVRSSLETDCQ